MSSRQVVAEALGSRSYLDNYGWEAGATATEPTSGASASIIGYDGIIDNSIASSTAEHNTNCIKQLSLTSDELTARIESYLAHNGILHGDPEPGSSIDAQDRPPEQHSEPGSTHGKELVTVQELGIPEEAMNSKNSQRSLHSQFSHQSHPSHPSQDCDSSDAKTKSTALEDHQVTSDSVDIDKRDHLDAIDFQDPASYFYQQQAHYESTPSIHSLQDIPCVDQTLDSAFVSDRISFQSTHYNSTPHRHSGIDSYRDDRPSIYSDRNSGHLAQQSLLGGEQNELSDITTQSQGKESTGPLIDPPPAEKSPAVAESLENDSSTALSRQPPPTPPTEVEVLESAKETVTSSPGTFEIDASIHAAAERLVSWAALTESTIISCAELARAANNLAGAVASIVPAPSADVVGQANQYHSLKEQFTRALNAESVQPPVNHSDKTSDQQLSSWEHRQLVDSFVTLVRTSPRFIASAFSRFSANAACQFCSPNESSGLTILFNCILGFSPFHRATVLIDIVDTLWGIERPTNTSANRQLFLSSILERMLFSTMGSLDEKNRRILDRFLRQTLHKLSPDLNRIMPAMIPPEVFSFVAALPRDCDTQMTVEKTIIEYFTHIFNSPHKWTVLSDVYLSEDSRRLLTIVAERSYNEFQVALREHRQSRMYESSFSNDDEEEQNIYGPLWERDEILVLQGSEIISLFHALLPNSPSNDDGLDEWCLDNIRSDLLPVIRDITHTPGRSNLWQVFKLGQDGLAADLKSDVVATQQIISRELDVVYKALLEVLAKRKDRRRSLSVHELLRIASDDAELCGDYFVKSCIDTALTKDEDRLRSSIANGLKAFSSKVDTRAKELQVILDRNASMRHAFKARLQNLMTSLDNCRIHVWYDHEARLGTPFMKARELIGGLYPDVESESSGNGLNGTVSGGTLGGTTSTLRSRRLSLLSSHFQAEPVLVSKEYLKSSKLVDKEVDTTLLYMRRHHVRNVCPAEEIIHRAHTEIALLARKLVERDALSGTMSFKRDLYPHAHGHHHRRSSLGLFDILDPAPPPPVSYPLSGIPSVELVTTLLLSDLGRKFIDKGTETDQFMRQTGQMLLEGDGHAYQPLLDDVSLQYSPSAQLDGFLNLVKLAVHRLEVRLPNGTEPSRADVSHELVRSLGREGGTLYGDLQSVLFHVSARQLPDAFLDLVEAAGTILETVIGRSTNLAERILRYHIESTNQASVVANLGISDSVSIWSYCARHGKPGAAKRLAELYEQYPHTVLQLKPFSRSSLFDNTEPSAARSAVISHWSNQR